MGPKLSKRGGGHVLQRGAGSAERGCALARGWARGQRASEAWTPGVGRAGRLFRGLSGLSVGERRRSGPCEGKEGSCGEGRGAGCADLRDWAAHGVCWADTGKEERGVGRAGFGVGFGPFLLLFYFLSLFSSISYSTNSTKAL